MRNSHDVLRLACGDQSSPIDAPGTVHGSYMPYPMEVTGVRASLKEGPSSGTMLVDVREEGVSILAAPIELTAGAMSSTGMSNLPFIVDNILGDAARITVVVTDEASGDAVGLTVDIIGYRWVIPFAGPYGLSGSSGAGVGEPVLPLEPPPPPLTVTINQGSGQADPSTTGTTVVFDVVFSEAVTGFATGDVTLSGTANPATGTVVDSGDHIHFTVNVTGMTGAGTVIASISAGVCTSVAAGLANVASTSTDNTVTLNAWTPAAIDGATLKAWYDARAGVTNAGAGAVSAWADQSSNNLDLSQGTGGVRPTTGANTLNGQNVLTFVADYLTAAAAADWKFMHDGSEWMVSMVVKVGTGPNPATTYGLLGTNGGSSSNIGASAWYEDAAADGQDLPRLFVTRGVGGTSCVNMSPNTAPYRDSLPADEWVILTILCDPNLGTANNRGAFFINRGLAIDGNAVTGAVSGSNPTFALQIGAMGNNVLPGTFQLAEAVFSTAWADRDDIENYLAREWAMMPVTLDTSVNVTVES